MPRAVDGMPDAVFDAGEIAAYARTDIADPDMGRKYYVVCAKMLVSNKKKYGTAQIKIKSMTGLKNRKLHINQAIRVLHLFLPLVKSHRKKRVPQ